MGLAPCNPFLNPRRFSRPSSLFGFGRKVFPLQIGELIDHNEGVCGCSHVAVFRVKDPMIALEVCSNCNFKVHQLRNTMHPFYSSSSSCLYEFVQFHNSSLRHRGVSRGKHRFLERSISSTSLRASPPRARPPRGFPIQTSSEEPRPSRPHWGDHNLLKIRSIVHIH